MINNGTYNSLSVIDLRFCESGLDENFLNNKFGKTIMLGLI